MVVAPVSAIGGGEDQNEFERGGDLLGFHGTFYGTSPRNLHTPCHFS